MPVTLYSMSGSPYAWRAWLALVHKGVAFTHRTMSYDAGDFKSEEFRKLTPRRRVPVLVDDEFALYESAAIVEYVEERWPQPSLFSADLHQRAVERRLVREADSYFAERMERLVEAVLFTPEAERDSAHIADVCSRLKSEYALWETLVTGDYLSGALSAARRPQGHSLDAPHANATGRAGDLAAALEIVTPESASTGSNLQRLFFVGENAAAHASTPLPCRMQ